MRRPRRRRARCSRGRRRAPRFPLATVCGPCPQGIGPRVRHHACRTSLAGLESASPDPERLMKPIPTEIVFLSAKRTPFGTYGGSLQDPPATHLSVHAAKAAPPPSQGSPPHLANRGVGHRIQTRPRAPSL